MKNTIFYHKLNLNLILQKLPEQSQSPDIPLSIESPAVSYLDLEFIPNYCAPLPGIQVEKISNY
jgi:hypothetical protein